MPCAEVDQAGFVVMLAYGVPIGLIGGAGSLPVAEAVIGIACNDSTGAIGDDRGYRSEAISEKFERAAGAGCGARRVALVTKRLINFGTEYPPACKGPVQEVGNAVAGYSCGEGRLL